MLNHTPFYSSTNIETDLASAPFAFEQWNKFG